MTREADALLARSSCDNIWESVAHSPQLSHLIFDWASIQELNYADPVYTHHLLCQGTFSADPNYFLSLPHPY